MRKPIFLAFLLVLFPSLMFGFGFRRERREIMEKEVKVPVKVEKVKRGEIKKTIDTYGNILPYKRIIIYSKVPGVLERLYFDEGDRVKEGELLAEIEHEELELRIKSLKASLKMAEIELERIKKDFKRISSLYKEKAVSSQQYDDIKAGYETAKARVESIKANLSLAEKQLKDSYITAPFSGIIEKKFVDEGEMITGSSMMKSSPIYSLIKVDKVKIIGEVAENDFPSLKKGMKVLIKVDAYPEKLFEGRVTDISPSIDPLSRTGKVKVEIDNPQYKLKPGMFARMKIIVKERKNTLVINEKAIFKENSKFFVWVVKNGKVRKRYVEKGIEERRKVEILKGLEEGEEVVIEGGIGLKEGMEVEVRK
ncbi:efflux RND transporter periplasmic adaptor subunit [Candidatus Calescamantes bacterium]|nr:efflux RND transporter periplasmic adaptor subunit [Candidatus Calescamantes bacterium]